MFSQHGRKFTAGSRQFCAGPCVSVRARWKGFSLLEVLTVIAIIAILAVIATPSYTELLRRNRLAAASSAMQVSLNLARSEAVKRGGDARVTVAANGTAGRWANGWTVFVDRTTDANGEVAPADDSNTDMIRLEVTDAPAGPVSAAQNGAINSFTYNGRGRLIDISGGGVVNRSFWFFDGVSEKYCLIVNNAGRVRADRTASTVNCPQN
ncbi:MAG: prepilin-type N-terminal cleavage/methylation domain-containing protein [Burkholderiaceae bacterium]|nr:MAG: prepilin-type N-terminal cleavage/methylation domain-containing protein [Burkholderiaceae bacterium]